MYGFEILFFDTQRGLRELAVTLSRTRYIGVGFIVLQFIDVTSLMNKSYLAYLLCVLALES